MRCVWCRNDVTADLGISSLFLWNSRPICRQCQQLFHSLEKELTCPGCGRFMDEATRRFEKDVKNISQARVYDLSTSNV